MDKYSTDTDAQKKYDCFLYYPLKRSVGKLFVAGLCSLWLQRQPLSRYMCVGCSMVIYSGAGSSFIGTIFLHYISIHIMSNDISFRTKRFSVNIRVYKMVGVQTEFWCGYSKHKYSCMP